MASPDILQNRSSFTFFKLENLRFSDTDMVGHINNVAFAALIETGRTYFTQGGEFPESPEGTQLVTARLEIDYRAELHWPGNVEVGTVLLSLGRSSFVLGNAIFKDELCAATSRTVLVLIDRGTRRPCELRPAYREALSRYLVR